MRLFSCLIMCCSGTLSAMSHTPVNIVNITAVLFFIVFICNHWYVIVVPVIWFHRLVFPIISVAFRHVSQNVLFICHLYLNLTCGSISFGLPWHEFAFSALTLFIGHQEEHPACKKWVMRWWHGYLSGARCKCFAYGPADATATPSCLASLKSRLVWPFPWFNLSSASLASLSWKIGH